MFFLLSYLSRREFEQLLSQCSANDFCTRNEFILLMLDKVGKLDKQACEVIQRQFDKMDIDGSGRITMADVQDGLGQGGGLSMPSDSGII